MTSDRLALPPRVVTLVLCRGDGSVLGALPPFEVELPWWQEVHPVVAGAREHFGAHITVLRLLAAQPHPQCAGGPVAYLAELDGGDGIGVTALLPWVGVPNADEPLRAPWARPGGPAADLEWADSVLEGAGDGRVAPAVQMRSWNLSSLWRLPTRTGAAWLKVVPSFFDHEGAVLAQLDARVTPPLLGVDGARILMTEVPGEDQYEATGSALVPMVEMIVDLQASWMDRTHELLELGAPDWRAGPLTELLGELVHRWAHQLEPEIGRRLDTLASALPGRLAAVARCGVPDTLVHGDFHRGNVRGTPPALVLLDWGDCGVGHPMLDQAAFLSPLEADDQDLVRKTWTSAWQLRVPGCDPERAATLLAPVAALRQALIYQQLLDGIEPDERIYHAPDPLIWLTRAAELTP